MLPRSRDLDRKDCLELNLQQAFPIPESGAFSDLLAAIDAVSPLARSRDDRP